jgi:DNA-directed RNA polymerase subunit K/omega
VCTNKWEGTVIHRPPDLGVFEFVVLAGLRAAQLTRGCTPRVEGSHKIVTTAQMEVASGKVARLVVDSILPVE